MKSSLRSAAVRGLLAGTLAVAAAACAHVTPNQRERLASPAMQFEMDPVAENQTRSVLEITEGSSFASAGPGTAGAGCGCN